MFRKSRVVEMTYAVPEPVGGGGETDTASTDGQREDLADDDPRAGTPGGGEEENVDADEGDHSGDGGVALVGGDTNDGDEELADNHTAGTVDHDRSATELLNDVEGDRGGDDVDDGGDHGDQEGVGDSAEIGEERGAEVEDEVDTSPLLHHLQGGTEDRAAKVGAGLEERALEAVQPGGDVAVLGNDGHLVLVVGNNFSKFLLDVLRVAGLVANTSEHDGGLLDVALLDEVTRSLREEEKTHTEDQGPEHLETNWDAVRTGGGVVLGAVVDARRGHKTNRNGKLVTRDNSTTNLPGGNLGHIENDDGRDETHTETGDQTAGHEETERGGGSLEDDTDNEDTTASNDGGSATEPIGKITSDNGAEESTSGEDRGDQGLLP